MRVESTCFVRRYQTRFGTAYTTFLCPSHNTNLVNKLTLCGQVLTGDSQPLSTTITICQNNNNLVDFNAKSS